MIMMDRFADAINKLKTDERIGRRECILYSTKLTKAVLDVMKRESYINSYEEFVDGKIRRIKVQLSNRINGVGVIKPRYSVGNGEITRYETRYIPSRDFGILIISTPKGMMTNREAKEAGIGGRLIAYVY